MAIGHGLEFIEVLHHFKHPKVNALLKKIAIIGPESTGKSTLAGQLAQLFDTVCVPEYARYYCERLNRQYTLQDEINMFYGQLALEDAATSLSKHGILICDTTAMTIKVWSDYLFGSTPSYITDHLKNRKYDLYLLMDIDLPWQDDPLRDFPDQREYFMEVWKKELESLHANYSIISGQGNQRLYKGEQAVRDFLEI